MWVEERRYLKSLCIYISGVWLTACGENMELLIKSWCPSERKRGC